MGLGVASRRASSDSRAGAWSGFSRRNASIRSAFPMTLPEIALHAIRLFDDVAGNHPFCDLVTVRVGIEEYLSAELFEDILYAGSCDLRDIFEVHVGEAVQTGHQCDVNIVGLFHLFGFE